MRGTDLSLISFGHGPMGLMGAHEIIWWESVESQWDITWRVPFREDLFKPNFSWMSMREFIGGVDALRHPQPLIILDLLPS